MLENPAMSKIKMRCKCGVEYSAKQSDVDRGWGRSCSKRCAAKKRERRNGHRFRSRGDGCPTENQYDTASSVNEAGWDGHKQETGIN